MRQIVYTFCRAITLILLFEFGFENNLNAQNLLWDINYTNGSVEGMDLDAQGKLYVLLDLDSGEYAGPGITQNFISQKGLYLLKLTNSGAFVWLRSIYLGSNWQRAHNSAQMLDVGKYGKLYLAMAFVDSIDVNPTGVSDMRYSNGSRDYLITSFDTSGNYLWSTTFGGVEMDAPFGLKEQNASTLLVGGYYQGQISIGSSIINSDNGSRDACLVSISTLASNGGSINWIKGFGGTGADVVFHVNVFESTGEILLSGLGYSDTIDLNPSPSAQNLFLGSPGYGYTTKLSSVGNYVWGFITNSDEDPIETPNRTYVNDFNEIFIVGNSSNGIRDYDPSAALYNSPLTPCSNLTPYIQGLSSGMQFNWARTFSNCISARVDGAVIDDNGGVIISVQANNNTVFQLDTTNIDTLFNTGWTGYAIGYDRLGNYTWRIENLPANAEIKRFGDTLFVENSVGIYAYQIPEPCTISNTTLTQTACDSYTWPLNGQTYTASGTYLDTLTSVGGCDSVVSLNLTINTSPILGIWNDTTIVCLADTFLLEAPMGFDSYTWSVNHKDGTLPYVYDTTTSIQATISCNYIITVFNDGCAASDTTFLHFINPNLKQFNPQNEICVGDTLNLVTAYSQVPSVILTDIQGNTYNTTTIGSQTWMAENLKTNFFTNGDSIPQLSGLQLQNAAGWNYYDEDISNNNLYGKLYNWWAVFDQRKVCPSGWRIPSQSDFVALSNSLSTTNVAEALKSTSGWNSSNNGTNSSGFNASPGGMFTQDNGYYAISNGTSWWTTDQLNHQPLLAWIYINDSNLNVNLFSDTKKDFATYIRCLKGEYDFQWSTGEITSSINVTPTETTTYYVTITDGVGSCVDSVTVTVNSITGTDIQTACDSYTWIDGVTYTASTSTPTFTLTNVAGCDSVVTLNLTINNASTGTDIQTACDTYTWIDGVTYTTSTSTPTFTLTNAAGCDSVLTLDLTIDASSIGPQTFEWAKSVGGNSVAFSITSDAIGNVYTMGWFGGSVDFDPGVGTANLTSAGAYDTFVQKLDANGNFIWAKSFGGDTLDQGRSITADALGNTYIIGQFGNTVDFDPGPGITNLTSLGSWDIFVQKLDNSGNFVWAKSFGGADNRGYSISVDASGNVYTTGYFRDTVDFDPGPGIANLYTNGNQDVFVQKLDNDGNFVWAKSFGGSSNDKGSSITEDIAGNIYVTGYFYGTADLDPGAGIASLTSAGADDVFVQKLDTSGSLVWVKSFGGSSIDEGYSVAVDASGNVYTTGYFFNTVDFDPGPGTFNLSSPGTRIVFTQKLDASGNFVWAKSFGGQNLAEERSNAVDVSGSIYTTGRFVGLVDFDPGAGIANLSSNGSEDVFIQKLDSLGNFVWAKSFGGSSNENVFSILVNPSGNLYTTGSFKSTVDFDPDTGSTTLTSVGTANAFIHKMSPQPFTEVQTACDSYTWIDGVTYTASTSTPTFTLTNAGGCDSVVTLDLTINSSYFTQIDTLVDTTGVGQYIWQLNGNAYTVSGTYYDTLASAAGCDSIIELSLDFIAPHTLNITATDTIVCAGTVLNIAVTINVEADSSDSAFIMKVRTSNSGTSNSNQFQLTGAEGEYNIVTTHIASGNTETFNNLSGQQTLSFSNGAGDYLIKVFPTGSTPFHRIQFNNGGDRSKLIDISQWGAVNWSSFQNAFHGCNNMIVSATDAPNLSTAANLSSMFRGASTFNQPINHWDVSMVNNTTNLFLEATSFNQSLSAWNVSSVTNMGLMFFGAQAFNQNISTWDVSSVTNMTRMFEGAASFNQSISSWDVSSVNYMNRMFFDASNFNQDLTEWCVTNMTTAPIDFSTNSLLSLVNRPVWGTCP